MTEAFDTNRYRDRQVEAFLGRIPYGKPTVVEFGGKPFGDYHASRVLPGYDPDVKADIVKAVHSELATRSKGGAAITMAVHAKDVLARPDGRRPSARIRGDYGITYGEEVFRLADEARTRFGIYIANVAITSTPLALSDVGSEYIQLFQQRLEEEFSVVRVLPEIENYPDVHPDKIVSELTKVQPITAPEESEIIVSPGGGSGKFSVAITELAHKMSRNEAPHYIKFETFPVFHLPVDYPLNVAFKAATLDLANELVQLSNGDTNYDKDVGNFRLLQALIKEFPEINTALRDFKEPTDMGVNVIESGISDHKMVEIACFEEVCRRIARYQKEADNGEEDEDVAVKARELLQI